MSLSQLGVSISPQAQNHSCSPYFGDQMKRCPREACPTSAQRPQMPGLLHACNRAGYAWYLPLIRVSLALEFSFSSLVVISQTKMSLNPKRSGKVSAHYLH